MSEYTVLGLPATIRIGLFDFDLVVDPDLACTDDPDSGWAVFSSNKQRIAIRATLPSAAVAADVMLHEVMHAVWWASNLRGNDTEERIIGTLATGVTQVHRDNPWLAKWLNARLA